MIRRSTVFACVFAVTCLLIAPLPLEAQTPDDTVLNVVEPDLTLINLPTSLRLAQWKSSFRVTHRFARPLSCEECEHSWMGDFFGTDQGALIGVEYRIGIMPNVYAGIRRVRGDRTIDIFGQWGLTRQMDSMPLEMAAHFSIEGTDNFSDEYSPSLGLVVTRLVNEAAAIHIEPIWVGNSNVASDEGDDNTFMLGLGARIRVRPTLYINGEWVPRISGYKPGNDQGSFSIEKRVGGHQFSLVFSNSYGTTMRQVANGGFESNDWFMGFSISRKFY